MGKLIAAGTAARSIGVARKTVVKWIKRGVIAGKKVGGRWYVYRTALVRLLDNGENKNA